MSIPMIAVATIALALLLIGIERNLRATTGQMVYFDNMNRVYRLAETGLNTALGTLAVDGSTMNVNGIETTVPNEGKFINWAQPDSSVVAGGYYVVTSATRTENGREYACKLHTYALVANLGDYFAIVSDFFTLSPGMDSSLGKIYAPTLTFLTLNGLQTKAADAEYVFSCTSVNNDNILNPIVNDVSEWLGLGIVPTRIQIAGSNTQLPKQLTNLKTLPVLNDLTRYETLAGPHTQKSLFTDLILDKDIYPPGYEGTEPNLNGTSYADNYAFHTTNNEHHIYYSSITMVIGNRNLLNPVRIHGQVLFVSAGDIILQGDIRSVDDGLDWLPGAGYISSSTAHQAVFMTAGNIIIDPSYMNGAPRGSTMTVQGLLFAPNGALTVNNTLDDATLWNLNHCYNFKGSEVLGTIDLQPRNLPTQFRGPRYYEYMSTLKDKPPPYLPAFAEIYYSLEEITKSHNLF